MTNRDESRARAAALPPAVRRAGVARVIWPIDPAGGGTWIAANEHGVVASLLNVNPGSPATRSGSVRSSRGMVIPELIGATRAADAIKRLGALDLSEFQDFRVVIADVRSVFEARWHGGAMRVERRIMGPACFASSGLGDTRALPRIDLWRSWLAEGQATPELQDAFHRHQWPDRPEVSVRMCRADARTVSTTVVEVRGRARAALAGSVVMTYSDDAQTVVRRIDPADEPHVELVCTGERVRC